MIQEIIKKLVEKQNMTEQEAETAMNEIMEGQATHAQMAAFLVALKIKGETAEEIVGCVRIMREKAIRIKTKLECIDTCGTGGDNLSTFNISTIAAFIVAAAGVSVAKHGNKAVSSSCGSADLLEKLGVKIMLEPEKVEKCINEIGIGFMLAPIFHVAMKNVMPVRKELGIRTIFNILGPLCNPALVKKQLIGVFMPELTEIFAQVLKCLESVHVLVVHGYPLDEISIIGKTKISELKDGKIKTYYIEPEQFGIKRANIEDLQTKGEDSSEIALGILQNKIKDAKRDAVLLNAAAALYSADKCKSIKDGLEIAKKVLEEGKAFEKLEQLKELSNKL